MIDLDAAQFPRIQRQVLERLAGEQESGRLHTGQPLGSELALADRLGVSRNTVRAVVRALENAGAVRRIPRRGIFLTASFRLGGGRSGNGRKAERFLLIRWCDSLMESAISDGLQEFAREYRLPLRILYASQSAATVAEILDHLEPGETAILLPVELPGVPEAMRRALGRGVRLLQLDRYLEDIATPAVLFDHYSGAVQTTRHLLEQAEIPVWYFGYLHPVSAARRHAGWRDCMLEYGFNRPGEFEICCGGERLDVEQQTEEFFIGTFREFYRRHLDRRLAVFCIADSLARMVYRVAAEFNREIGRDLIVAGFGNEPLGFDPPLTTVRPDQKLLTRAAGECLLNWPKIANYRQVLPVELIRRSSSRFIPVPLTAAK